MLAAILNPVVFVFKVMPKFLIDQHESKLLYSCDDSTLYFSYIYEKQIDLSEVFTISSFLYVLNFTFNSS